MEIRDVKQSIEHNQTQVIDAKALAEQCNLSVSSLHRHFHRQFGMSMAKMQRDLRLNRAAYMLAFRQEMSILDIALTVGFDSHDGFGRAFQRYVGVTPKAYRASPSFDMQSKTPICIDSPSGGLASLTVDLVWFEPVDVAVLVHKGGVRYLPKSLGEFIGWRKSVGLSPSRSRTFNVMYADPNVTPDDEWAMGLAAELSLSVSLPETMMADTIGGETCLHVRWQGPEQSIGEIVHYLISHYADEQGYQIAHKPPVLERITFYPDVPAHEAVTDIWIPLKAFA